MLGPVCPCCQPNVVLILGDSQLRGGALILLVSLAGSQDMATGGYTEEFMEEYRHGRAPPSQRDLLLVWFSIFEVGCFK